MKFILNCQQAEELGKKLNDYSTKLSDTTSELRLLKVDGDFDWAGTINLINSNINITADRMKNAQKYIQLVVDKHTGLQKTFEYPTVVANDTVKKTTPVENPIPVPQDPTIKPSSSENQTDSTKATTINQKTSDTASSSETIVPPSSTTTSTSTTSPGITNASDYTTPDGARHFTIPEGNGERYTYMAWQAITSPSSNQYRLREAAGMNFDDEGFGRIDGRYVIACTTTFGQVGEYVDFKLEDGTILKCIIGDSKGGVNPQYNVSEWGHNNGKNVVEFIVDKNSWYNKKDNPGTPSNHPEWNHRVTEAYVYGNYFTDRRS